jgi:hypothetical protein
MPMDQKVGRWGDLKPVQGILVVFIAEAAIGSKEGSKLARDSSVDMVGLDNNNNSVAFPIADKKQAWNLLEVVSTRP